MRKCLHEDEMQAKEIQSIEEEQAEIETERRSHDAEMAAREPF